MIRAALNCTIAAAALWHPDLFAATSPGEVRELSRLSLEDLANVEVTSVSKAAQALSGAPAAIYVITREEIMRSGVTSIPEALRLAPNLQLAQISAGR
jgi:iron complex outermembrane recepter protein